MAKTKQRVDVLIRNGSIENVMAPKGTEVIILEYDELFTSDDPYVEKDEDGLFIAHEYQF